METNRLADAVAGVRAAHAEPYDAEGLEERLDDTDSELYSVLDDIEMGSYGPSAADMRAGLELIADGSTFGWDAGELGAMARSLLKGLPAA